jgi:hypothetical protein
MENLKTLTKEELVIINGGNFIKDISYVNGYVLGYLIDEIHGVWDGLMGVDKH